jgi:hypothetical protein
MMATIIMNHIAAMVLPRSFSAESSAASERYETLEMLYPMPQAPKASAATRYPAVPLPAIRKATCGETTSPTTHSSKPIRM